MPPVGERVTYIRKPEELTPERKAMIDKEAQKIRERMPLLAPPRSYAPRPPMGDDGVFLCPEREFITKSAMASYTLDNRPGFTFFARVARDNNGDHYLTVDASQDSDGEVGGRVTISLEHRPYVPSDFLGGLHIPGSSGFTFEQWIDAMQNIQETLDLVERANVQKYGYGNLNEALGIPKGLPYEALQQRYSALRALQKELDPELDYPTKEELLAQTAPNAD